MKVNKGAQDGNENENGAGTGTVMGVETCRRTPDGNGDGNGDGSEDSSGYGNGDEDSEKGNDDRMGRAEERRRSARN